MFNFSEPYNDVYSKNFAFLRMDSFSAIMILGPEFYMFIYIFICLLILTTHYYMRRNDINFPKINKAIAKNIKPVINSNSMIRVGL